MSFDHTGVGLVLGEQETSAVYVTIITKDRTSRRIPAHLQGPHQLIVDLQGIAEPEKSLYAWTDNPLDRLQPGGFTRPSFFFSPAAPGTYSLIAAS
ncbi:MAG: hypothetical protein LBQ30_07360 [Treponema sp.]|nr:hypothetical protein [Treponema sp.]